jgi:hypothetical protein
MRGRSSGYHPVGFAKRSGDVTRSASMSVRAEQDMSSWRLNSAVSERRTDPSSCLRHDEILQFSNVPGQS